MRAAITRKPAPSKRRYTSPIKLRPTPSGFTMERVRSIGMMTSGCLDGESAPKGGRQRPRSVLERGPPSNQDGCRSPCITWKNRVLAAGLSPFPKLDVEALAAAAFTLGLGVLELERLVQTLLHEIHQRSIDQRQAGPVDHHLDSARLEHRVLRADFVGIIHHVRKSGTSGFLDADPQADARASLFQMRTDPISRRFRQQYCHTTPPLVDWKKSPAALFRTPASSPLAKNVVFASCAAASPTGRQQT